jgi:CheY-like chemotaxis protein
MSASATLPTLLLVEDNPDDVELVQRAFRRTGFSIRILTVADGEQATQYLSGAALYADRHAYPLPDLVLLDLKLPKLDGHGVLAWVRAQALFDTLPIVVLSSSGEREDIAAAYQAGANSFLRKPFDFAALQNLLGLVYQYWLESNRSTFTETNKHGRAADR